MEYSYTEDADIKGLFDDLYNLLQRYEDCCPFWSKEYSRFRIGTGEYTIKTKLRDITDNVLSVTYNEIVPSNGARQILDFKNAYDETGFRFEFCSDETRHPYLPHVNATLGRNRDSSKMVRIAIRSCEVLDALPREVTPRKIKPALKYVKEHREELLEEWDKYVQTTK